MRSRNARTKRPNRAQVREQLVEAAGEALAERGFEVSVEEITERAGFSRGAFYSNYSSKEELFLEALKRRTQERITDLQRQLEGSTDLWELLERLAKGRPRRSHREFAHYMQFYFHCLARPEFRPHLAAVEDARKTALREAIDRAMPPSGIPREHLDFLTQLLAAVDDGLAIQTYLHGKAQPLDTRSLLTLANAAANLADK